MSVSEWLSRVRLRRLSAARAAMPKEPTDQHTKALGHSTPLQAMRMWREQKPGLFVGMTRQGQTDF